MNLIYCHYGCFNYLANILRFLIINFSVTSFQNVSYASTTTCLNIQKVRLVDGKRGSRVENIIIFENSFFERIFSFVVPRKQ